MPASIGVNMRVTGHYSQGGRKYMEDKFSVAYQQTEDERDLEYAYFGIFDGHGGSEAAIFAKEHLMDSIVKQKHFWSENDEDVLKAIRHGYMMTHMNMWNELEKWPKTVSGLPSTAGTTASIAFIRRGKIYIGHVGDSAIILGYQVEGKEEWCAKALTFDHKPECSAEMSRIHSSGGKVIAKAGVPRVVWNRLVVGSGGMRYDEIPFLAVARSLGDLWSYNSGTDEFVVSPDPDVGVLTIDPAKFRCLIFGTDGLWNMVSPEAAVHLVQAAERHNEGAPPPDSWINPSKILVDSALQRWTTTKMRADNTSVVTLMMDPPGPPRNRAPMPQPIPAPCSPTISGDHECTEPYTATSPSPAACPSGRDCSGGDPPSSGDEEAPAETPASRGLSIVTRFPDPRPPIPTIVPSPQCVPQNQPPCEEGEEQFIANYGNPSESYFIARLLNKTQLRNTLQNIHEEISMTRLVSEESVNLNNNVEENVFGKTTILQRPQAPSPVVELKSDAVESEKDLSEDVEEKDLSLTDGKESKSGRVSPQESIQINEVSSSSPADAPQPKNRRSKGTGKQNIGGPTPPVRNLRSHDASTVTPRPQTRLNRGRQSTVQNKTKTPESKVPVPTKAAPQMEKVVILHRPKVVVTPLPIVKATPGVKAETSVKATPGVKAETSVKATPGVKAETSVKATPGVKAETSVKATPGVKAETSVKATPGVKAETIVKILKPTVVKQSEPSKAKVAPAKGAGEASVVGNIRVTRSKDTQPSPADILLKAVRDTASGVKKPQTNQESTSQQTLNPTVSVFKPREETHRPPRQRVSLPVSANVPKTGGTCLRTRPRETPIDLQESSKENIVNPASQNLGAVPLRSAKRRNSGGGGNEMEPKEKRRTRLDDKRVQKTDKTIEEQHQDISSTQQIKDTRFILLGLRMTSDEMQGDNEVPNRRSTRHLEEVQDSGNASPKSKLKNIKEKRFVKLGLVVTEDGNSSEVHSTTLNLENDPISSKDSVNNRALRSRQDIVDKKMEENLVEKRSLRSSLPDRVDMEECRPVLRSRNSVAAPGKVSPRRKAPWPPTPRHGLRKKLTKG